MSSEQDALTCPTCAALVAAGGQQKHQEFHGQVVTQKAARDARSSR